MGCIQSGPAPAGHPAGSSPDLCSGLTRRLCAAIAGKAMQKAAPEDVIYCCLGRASALGLVNFPEEAFRHPITQHGDYDGADWRLYTDSLMPQTVPEVDVPELTAF